MNNNTSITYEEIMSVIASLPINTNLLLQIVNQSTQETLEKASFLFFDPETKKDVRKYQQTEIMDMLKKYGNSGYTILKLEWYQGFGANISLKVFYYQERGRNCEFRT